MAGYRLTYSAQQDIVANLAWSDAEFGTEACKRYEALITAALRDAASRIDGVGLTPRPELGDGVFSWHLAQSRGTSAERPVRRPRHFLLCWPADDVLVVGRVLHDAMEPRRHLDRGQH